MSDEDNLLRERGTTHGEYAETAALAQALKTVMATGRNWPTLHPIHRESLELKATKIARILCGSPNCRDHWIDDAGYSHLAANAC